ncbi:uncharacterized protein LOC120335405 [Styela clava]
MKHNTYFSYILLALFMYLWSSVDGEAFNGTCQSQNSKTKQAYVNWPFSVNCDYLKSIWETKTHNIDDDNIQCIITQGDIEINDTILELASLTDNSNYTAKLIINNTICLTNKVQVVLRPFPEICKVGVNNAISRESTIGDSVNLNCRPPEGDPDIIPAGADQSKFKTRWYVNCKDGDYRTSQPWTEFPDPGYPNGLNMPRVDFYDAANFTCTVTFEGKILYAVTYAQCIKQRTESINPTITCVNYETKALRDTAVLDCEGQIVLGNTPSKHFAVLWQRNGDTICENNFFNQTSFGVFDQRQSCIVEGNNDSVVCVVDGENTKNEEIQHERKTIGIKLYIRDLKSNDMGQYTVNLGYFDISSNSWKMDEWDVKLNEDNTPRLLRLIMILSICLGVLIFIIMLVLLYKRFEIYILVAYKRSWLWKYDRDDKQYVCYLSYLYDTDTLSDKSLKSTVVYAIHNLLEDLNYTYYDEQRQIDFTVQVERITNLVERCHRMVFVLTPEYLNDRWMRFHTELGFHGLLESQMGLIFILTPGTKRVLKKIARTDKVWQRLLIAIKTNHVIKWREGMNEDQLKRNIEYRLPKLARRIKKLPGSDSSSTDGCNPDYTRSVSQTTTHTTVSDDGAAEGDLRL